MQTFLQPETAANAKNGKTYLSRRFAPLLLLLAAMFVVGCTKDSTPNDPPKEEKIAFEPPPRPKRNQDGSRWVGGCYIKQAQYTSDGRRIVALDTLH